jgi:hypothetical protein
MGDFMLKKSGIGDGALSEFFFPDQAACKKSKHCSKQTYKAAKRYEAWSCSRSNMWFSELANLGFRY